MKRLLSFICSIALAGSISITALASDKVEITKTMSEAAGQAYTLVVGDGLYYDEATSDANSTVTFSFEFGQTSGVYKYTITSETGLTVEDEFVFVEPAEYKQAFSSLSTDCQSGDVSAVEKDLLETYANIFGLDRDFNINSSILALGGESKAIKAFIDEINSLTEDPTIEDVQRIYREKILLYAIEAGDDSLIANAVSNYSELLGLTDEKINDAYNALSSSAKQNVASLEKGTYKTTAEFAKAHAKVTAIGVMNASTQYTALGEAITNFGSYADISLPSTLATKDKNTVLQYLAKVKPFTSTEDFNNKLSQAISSLNNSSSTTKKSTGGGGGGGSSSYSSTTTKDTYTKRVLSDCFGCSVTLYYSNNVIAYAEVYKDGKLIFTTQISER